VIDGGIAVFYTRAPCYAGDAPMSSDDLASAPLAALNVVRSDDRLAVKRHALAGRWLMPPRCRAPEVIVFLHEALGSIAQWKDFPDRLCAAAQLRGLVFDRLGHGQSPPATEPRTVDYLRAEGEEWLPALLAAAAIDRPVLFGHSDGGSIALYYAAAAAATAAAPAALITEAAHVFVEEITLRGIRTFGESWEATALPQRLARYHGDKTEAVYRAWHDTWLTPPFHAFQMTDRLAHIRCPSLIMQGQDDEYGTPAQVEAIVRGIGAAARPWLLPGCGHAPHLEQGPQVTREVARFLSAAVR
jgi:pimeloyl-ACP methyl ester carboxylesterase